MVKLLLPPVLLLAALVAPGRAAAAPPPSSPPLLLGGDAVVFVGRVQKGAAGTTMFDMNGVQIKTTVTGTTGLFASLSQVQKVEGNVFQVYLDGLLQPSSRFNTSAWVAGQVVKVPLFPRGSLDAASAHAVTIFKDTEPSFATTEIKLPNYITFHGFSGDATARLLPALESSAPQHKVEFLVRATRCVCSATVSLLFCLTQRCAIVYRAIPSPRDLTTNATFPASR